MFFPRGTIILFQVAKKLEKRNGEMVLYFYFAFNREAVHIEKRKLKINKMAIYCLQDYLFVSRDSPIEN